MVFYLDGQYLLTDFETPYTFTLPSANWVDGSHTLEAEAIERDGFVADHAAVRLTFANGVTTPPKQPTGFKPTPGTTPAAGQPYVLAAVGDGAAGQTSAGDVSDLIASWNPNAFLYLGDVYEKGTATEFMNWYGVAGASLYFGRFSNITDPTVGNHEYTAGKAPGYFGYWKTPKDYYSVNTPAGWHLISLNSNLDGSVGSAQYNWLSTDLTNNTQAVHARVLPPPAVQHRSRAGAGPFHRDLAAARAKGSRHRAERPRSRLPALGADGRKRHSESRPDRPSSSSGRAAIRFRASSRPTAGWQTATRATSARCGSTSAPAAPRTSFVTTGGGTRRLGHGRL